ncbi:hypothetical protein RirG_163800 [Rhizophagus irregularis DAOM 197198w]|uniref:Uncharacterized protein n=1 Tax=Rhizophagus irregularis (strain DAOM 197198w) TaxID=1432141 RepID=A0A015K454_RHIIW|nr:hypothetical protein RirG_163800 [Rhizophagus irregularis DAOM 197198w]
MSDTPQIINHETPQKTNDVERMERVLRLKDLKEVTEKNLNLVRKAKRDQRLAIFFSVTVIIIGIVFITYESVNKDSTAFKIVANSLSGILSGSIIFSSIKGIFEINEKSKIIDKINIGPSVVDIEKGDIWAHDKKETLDDVKNIIKIVRERNENLNRMRIAFILSKRTNRTDDYIYTISVLLITGGITKCFTELFID